MRIGKERCNLYCNSLCQRFQRIGNFVDHFNIGKRVSFVDCTDDVGRKSILEGTE